MLKSIREIIAFNLVMERKRAGLNQTDLASLAGISLRSVQRIENPLSEGDIGVDTLSALAGVLNVSLARMLSDSDAIPKPSPIEALEVIAEALRKPTPLAEHPIITAKDLPAGIAADWVRDLVSAISGDPAMKGAVDSLLLARKRSRPKQSEDLG